MDPGIFSSISNLAHHPSHQQSRRPQTHRPNHQLTPFGPKRIATYIAPTGSVFTKVESCADGDEIPKATCHAPRFEGHTLTAENSFILVEIVSVNHPERVRALGEEFQCRSLVGRGSEVWS